jgi:ATP-binding cassette subfamily B protein
MSNHSAWMTMRSMSSDRDIVKRNLGPGLVRRILSYAKPYRVIVVALLVTLVLGSLLTVAQPLLFRRIIDKGVSVGDSAVVTQTALIIAGIAFLDAGLGLLSRWYSSRIGEGLIYDLRTEVFDHVQRQSIAFFTRAQTGALISRLNSDVIGAQQAFTSTLSGVVGNMISLSIVLVTMFILSWQVTLAALVLVPLFLLPARWMGRKLQQLTREQMKLNADMSNQMSERFNVAGALLVKLFGRPDEEAGSFSGKAVRVRDIGIKMAMANRWFFSALTLAATSSSTA